MSSNKVEILLLDRKIIDLEYKLIIKEKLIESYHQRHIVNLSIIQQLAEENGNLKFAGEKTCQNKL